MIRSSDGDAESMPHCHWPLPIRIAIYDDVMKCTTAFQYVYSRKTETADTREVHQVLEVPGTNVGHDRPSGYPILSEAKFMWAAGDHVATAAPAPAPA
eukprot:2766079-Pleurochrysis_carterae.AAC.1